MKIFQVMKRLLAITIILLSIASCTFINVSRTLNDVESYIMERPDSALAVLESIDRVDLNTARTKAHHALLHAMALDKNYIDVTEDSIAKVATEYYKKHGPRRNYARALYYLGKSYYYNEEYDKAILEYSKAEKVAVGCDSLYLGMIYSAEGDTYNKTYNSIEELNCIQKALKIFKEIDAEQYTRPITFSLGNAYHNCSRYEEAKKRYEALGVDVEGALKKLAATTISIHCWQGDDVTGFENADGALTGGIQATGNYPGKARTPQELMADFDKVLSLTPGAKKINLHACYAIFDGNKVDRDAIEPKHFAPWVAYAKERGIGIDFNPTCFSHPMLKNGLSLSSPDEEVRAFWIRHCIACRRIAAYFAKELGQPVVNNVWIPDGYKDIPADRLGPRMRLKDSLDQIFAEKLDGVIDCVESKVFGIGVESYTVGSNEFYMGYAASHPGVYNLLDNGHYHPTEVVSDKIPSLLAFFDKIPLHVIEKKRNSGFFLVHDQKGGFDQKIRSLADLAAKPLIRQNFFHRRRGDTAIVGKIAPLLPTPPSFFNDLCNRHAHSSFLTDPQIGKQRAPLLPPLRGLRLKAPLSHKAYRSSRQALKDPRSEAIRSWKKAPFSPSRSSLPSWQTPHKNQEAHRSLPR